METVLRLQPQKKDRKFTLRECIQYKLMRVTPK